MHTPNSTYHDCGAFSSFHSYPTMCCLIPTKLVPHTEHRCTQPTGEKHWAEPERKARDPAIKSSMVNN